MSARKQQAGRVEGRATNGREKPPLPRGRRPQAAMVGREVVAVMVGRVLRDWRRAAGVTQRELAEWTGLSEKAVAAIERDGVPDSAIRLALALGCRPSELLAEAEARVDEETARAAEARRERLREELGLASRRDSTRTPPFAP